MGPYANFETKRCCQLCYETTLDIPTPALSCTYV